MEQKRQRTYLNELGIEVWISNKTSLASKRKTNPAHVVTSTAAVDVLPTAPNLGFATPRQVLSAASHAHLPHNEFDAPTPQKMPPLAPKPVPHAKPQATSDMRDTSQLSAPIVTSTPVAYLNWEQLAERVRDCRQCTELTTHRTQTVFGVGDQKGPWLFIGEAPGADEDRQGEPFVGRAGRLLDNMMAALQLKRGDGVYIANIVKCRPPGNRNPHPSESKACRAFLDRQIALIQPRIIVALGAVAAQNLLSSDTPIGEMRGRLFDYMNIPVLVTYHPAYLLRSPRQKATVWRDLKLARQTFLKIVTGNNT